MSFFRSALEAPPRSHAPLAPTRVTVYHGTPRRIERFDPAFLGSSSGRDAQGPGFYFSSDPLDAARYGLGSPEGELLTCEVDVAGLVPTSRPAGRQEVEWLMAQAPDLLERLEDWGEEPNAAFRRALPAYQEKESAHDSFQSVWYDFYRGQEAAYAERLVALGYSGVIATGGEAAHLIVYDASAIHIRERSSPSAAFDSPTAPEAARVAREVLHQLAVAGNVPRRPQSSVATHAARPGRRAGVRRAFFR